MTKMKVGAVSALVVVAITVTIIQQSRLRQLAAENNQLQALSAELPTLRQEQDEATNRLHLMQEELNRSSRDTAELARLRGEAGVLKRQVAERGSSIKSAPIAPATLDVSSPSQSLSNLFSAAASGDVKAVRRHLTHNSPMHAQIDELMAGQEIMQKIQSVSVYVGTNEALAVSETIQRPSGESAVLFELRNVDGEWLLHKVRERDLVSIQERIQTLSQQQASGQQ